jgi:hypothetical protein
MSLKYEKPKILPFRSGRDGVLMGQLDCAGGSSAGGDCKPAGNSAGKCQTGAGANTCGQGQAKV